MSTLDVSKLSAQSQDFVRLALSDWNASAFTVRGALGGRSGSEVMLVEIRTDVHDGQGILKLSNPVDGNDEGSKQETIRSGVPGLSARIPRISHQFTEHERSALLMTVAGGGLLEAQMLSTVIGPQLNLAVQTLSNSLLQEWNPEPIFDGEHVPASAILSDWLGDRLGPKGRLPAVLRDILHVSPECLSFRYGGVDYPNPYGFVSQTFAGSKIRVSPARGLMHGDLHTQNVLISGRDDIANYYFIDFADCRNCVPLLYDHAYLELSLLLNARENVAHQRWHSICSQMCNVEDPRDANKAPYSDDVGLLWSAGLLRAEIHKWIKKRYPERKEDLKKQILLSRIASGLNFANKRRLSENETLSDKLKFFALLHAATAAKELFDYCQVPVDSAGPVVNPEGEIPTPSGSDWRKVWDACEGFDSRRAAYILLVGPEVANIPAYAHLILGRLPWSLIVDFDQSPSQGTVLKNAKPSLQRTRSFHELYPHQATALSFSSASYWLFADNDSNDGSEPLSLSQWRQETLPRLRNIANALHREIAPRSVHLVILGGTINPSKLRHAFAALEENVGGALSTLVVSNDDADNTFAVLSEETATIQEVSCDWRDLVAGVHQMLGEESEDRSCWIPVRDAATKVVHREQVSPEEVALYSSTVDIVPASGSSYDEPEREDEVADFFRGNTITWRELDLHRDVDRDITRGPNGVIQNLRNMLESSPNESFAIEHSPGAGGTTVARRVAWELRDDFPCVMVKAYSGDTVDIVDSLFRRTGLPLLIVIDGTVSGTQRDLFFNELKERSIRFVILDVRRRHQPRHSGSSAAVSDPMVLSEAKRFLDRYQSKAPKERRSALVRLSSDSEMAPYRSAFFFGLYTFEREFVRLEQFVEDMLREAAPQARAAIARLALITRYSQVRLPVETFFMLLGIDQTSERFNAAKILGDAAAKLVMFDGTRVGIAHPLLAEEILRRHLSAREELGEGTAGD
ncbi:MAG: hypothetical protein OXH92_16170 [Bryobacterales bacterium]|nr:hypothetical protein [Bryobacterales bacterium]